MAQRVQNSRSAFSSVLRSSFRFIAPLVATTFMATSVAARDGGSNPAPSASEAVPLPDLEPLLMEPEKPAPKKGKPPAKKVRPDNPLDKIKVIRCNVDTDCPEAEKCALPQHVCVTPQVEYQVLEVPVEVPVVPLIPLRPPEHSDDRNDEKVTDDPPAAVVVEPAPVVSAPAEVSVEKAPAPKPAAEKHSLPLLLDASALALRLRAFNVGGDDSSNRIYDIGLNVPVMGYRDAGLFFPLFLTISQPVTRFDADGFRVFGENGEMISFGGGMGFAETFSGIRASLDLSGLYSMYDVSSSLTSTQNNRFSSNGTETRFDLRGNLYLLAPDSSAFPWLALSYSSTPYLPSTFGAGIKVPFVTIAGRHPELSAYAQTLLLRSQNRTNNYAGQDTRNTSGNTDLEIPLFNLGRYLLVSCVPLLDFRDVQSGKSYLAPGVGAAVELFDSAKLGVAYVHGTDAPLLLTLSVLTSVVESESRINNGFKDYRTDSRIGWRTR